MRSTGDAAALAALARGYRVCYKKVPLEGGDCTMDHTAIVSLMDKDGRFLGPFNVERTADVAAADLRKHLDIVRSGRPRGQRGS
jgi:protein SCO1/2